MDLLYFVFHLLHAIFKLLHKISKAIYEIFKKIDEFFEKIDKYPSKTEERILVVNTISNQNFDLSKLKNNVVIVAFWADSCPVCRVKIIELDNLYKKYQGQSLEIIGLNVDGVTKNAQDLSYPIAIFEDASDTNFNKPKKSLPTIHIINKDGLINKSLFSPDQIKIDNIEKIIKPLLQAGRMHGRIIY